MLWGGRWNVNSHFGKKLLYLAMFFFFFFFCCLLGIAGPEWALRHNYSGLNLMSYGQTNIILRRINIFNYIYVILKLIYMWHIGYEFRWNTTTIHGDIFCFNLCLCDMSDIYVKRSFSWLSMPIEWGTFVGFMTGSVDNKGIKWGILKEKQLKLLSLDFLMWFRPPMLS